MTMSQPDSVSSPLSAHIRAAIDQAGSRLSFFDVAAVQAWLERELNAESQA